MRQFVADDNPDATEVRGVVGLLVERSHLMIIGLLGIVKAGGAYLPLDPAYPLERLAFVLEDADTPVLVTTSTLRQRLPEPDARVVQLDADERVIAARPATAPCGARRTPTRSNQWDRGSKLTSISPR